MAEDYMDMYKQALERLSTGGMSLEASLQEIEEGKKQAISRGQQSLVSGGLGGTTVMGGVPIQAEKIAAGQRLGARGRAEQTYLTTLASFASFAQRGIEAQKQRQFEAQQAGLGRRFAGQQAELERIAATGTTQYGTTPQKSLSQFMSEFDVRNRGDGGGGGGEYADQFPSLYDQQGTAVPDWTGGGGGGLDTSTYEQGWSGAQVIGEKGVLAGAPTSQEVGMPAGVGTLPGVQQPAAQKKTYKLETSKFGVQSMGVYSNGRRLGAYTMEQYAALNQR